MAVNIIIIIIGFLFHLGKGHLQPKQAELLPRNITDKKVWYKFKYHKKAIREKYE